MKMKRLIAFTLLGLGLSLSSAAEAARFQKYLNATSCPGSGLCNVDFANVPAGKTLDISNVSCYLRMEDSGAAGLYAMQLLQIGAGGGILNAVTLDPQITDSGTPTGQNFSSIWAANHTIYAFATAGQHFRATAQLMNVSGRITQFACHISGQLLP
jgi:hypothetical protein